MILTIDVEADWDSRTRDATHSFRHLHDIFGLLEDRDSSATLFVVSDLADQLKDAGIPKKFEIASHSKSHHFLSRLTPKQRISEIRDSKKQLERKFGTKVKGFRAPGFMTYPEMWKDLKSAGYTYSSSLVSGWFPGRYRHFFSEPHFQRDGVTEIPLQHFHMIPVAFGLPYYRLLYPFSPLLRPSRPRIFYMHPTEFLKTYPSAEEGALVRFLYSLRRGGKAKALFKKILDRHGPATTVDAYLKANLRSPGSSR